MIEGLRKVDAATFDEWVADQPDGQHYELINGEVFEKAMVTKPKHGHAATKLCGYLTVHLDIQDIDGYVTGETSGFQIGDQRYIPDGALVLGQPIDDKAYSTNRPTLMIEVISDPENVAERSTLDDKREVYLAAGITIWEANTQKRYVDVYTPDGRYQRVRDTLTRDARPRTPPQPRVSHSSRRIAEREKQQRRAATRPRMFHLRIADQAAASERR